VSWREFLSDEADLLLYGCDVAGTARGRELLDKLQRLAGADIAASDDPTGSTRQGGGWVLEYESGPLTTSLAISESFQRNWSQLLATNLVTTTNDSGVGSFRQAILDANTNAGADTINFNIGVGPQTITPLSALPTITGAVTIDATTQPGFLGVPLIQLNGTSAGAASNGLRISGGSSKVRGMVINRFGQSGILLDTAGGNTITGNYIGRSATGTLAIGNNGDGIMVSGADNNTIGGTIASAGNTIANNPGNGVTVDATSTGDLIEGNSIFSNGGLGIDLSDNGVTLNDAGDGDSGGNDQKNFPVITSATTTGTQLTVSGTYNSLAVARTYRIEFFANTTADPSGYGEGETYLGFTNVTTNSAGNAAFSATISASITGGGLG
jgi:hypothetical protein